MSSAVSFNFGAFGDILAVAQVSYHLLHTCRRSLSSADEYRSLKPEVDSLSYIVDCARTNINSRADDHLCPATKHALHLALSRSQVLIEEMKECVESYEGCLGDGGRGNVWRKTVGRVMWPMSGVVKKVEELRKEVMAKMVEVNLLLSLAKYVFPQTLVLNPHLTPFLDVQSKWRERKNGQPSASHEHAESTYIFESGRTNRHRDLLWGDRYVSQQAVH